MKIILTGGTGFIGTAVRRQLLSEAHQIYILTRQKILSAHEQEKFIYWNPERLGDWAACFDGADVVINLSGENIAGRYWTESQKQRIVQSRVNATRMIVAAIGQARKKPSTLINASAVGYYGHVPFALMTEGNGRGEGFLAETCEMWENEAMQAERFGVRVVLARLGPVLGEKGGMLSKMIFPYYFFLGGSLGSGEQWISWIHRDDVAGIFSFLMTHPSLSGPVNVAAPKPVFMKEFSSLLGNLLHRPSWLKVPSFVIRLIMGEMSSVVLEGQRVVPQKLSDQGYRFKYEDLKPALAAILSKKNA
ncbi:MAG TPA: TIGR01777 family oxidoreductase [Candidatus Omnitrophota bacterium]|nr:TIGR01777 family oxidoreductase [Candidatus Omnitrophota bacterium]